VRRIAPGTSCVPSQTGVASAKGPELREAGRLTPLDPRSRLPGAEPRAESEWRGASERAYNAMFGYGCPCPETLRALDRLFACHDLERSHQGHRLEGCTPVLASREALGIEELPAVAPPDEEAAEPGASRSTEGRVSNGSQTRTNEDVWQALQRCGAGGRSGTTGQTASSPSMQG